jgi:hypothetical protein
MDIETGSEDVSMYQARAVAAKVTQIFKVKLTDMGPNPNKGVQRKRKSWATGPYGEVTPKRVGPYVSPGVGNTRAAGQVMFGEVCCN